MIILLYGQDSYRIKLKFNEIKVQFEKKFPAAKSNIETVDFSEEEWDEAKTKLKSGPLFAEKRLIIVKNLFSGGKPEISEQEFASTFKSQANGESTFLFIEEDVPQKHLRWFSSLGALIQNFEFLAGSELKNWAKKRISDLGRDIENDALELLVSLTGDNLSALDNEIIKLLNYAGDSIALKDVENLTRGRDVHGNIFSWLDLIRSGNIPEALCLGNSLVDSGQGLPHITAILSGDFKDMLVLKELGSLPVSEVKEKIKMHPFRLRKLMFSAPRFSRDEILSMLNSILELDRRSKRESLSNVILFDFIFSCRVQRL